MTPEELKQMLMQHVTLEVGFVTNDPEDDTREVVLLFDGERIASARL